MKLFISYSSRDVREVEGLERLIAAEGFEVSKLAHGKRQEQGGDEQLNESSQRAIGAADGLLYIVSPFWQASKLGQDERQWGQESGKRAIAVIASAVSATAFSAETQVIDLTRDKKAGHEALRQALRSLKQGKASQSAAAKARQADKGGASASANAKASASASSPLDEISIEPHTPSARQKPDAIVPATTTTFEHNIRDSVEQARAALHTSSLPDWLGWALQKPITKNPGKAETREPQPTAPQAEILPPGEEASASATGDKAQQDFIQKLRHSYAYIRADSKRSLITASLAALMFGLLGWGLFGGVSEEARIRAELKDVKSRQALFLSKVSAHLLQSGDRETALLLALEAVEQGGSEQDSLEARAGLYTAWLQGHKGLAFTAHGNHVSSVSFSPDGLFVLSSSWDETVRLWEIKSGRQALALEAHDSLINSAVFSPNQRQILTAAVDGKARLFDSGTGKLIHSFDGHTDDLTGAQFTPDGKRFATASSDHSAQLWDIAGKKPVITFVGHKAGVESLGFNPGGSRLVTASADNTARIHDVLSGSPVVTLVGHEKPVRGVAYDASGGYIVTASEDRSARLWNAYTGKEVRRFSGHKWAVLGASFSSDGKYLVTGSKDNTARIWEVATGKALMVLKGHSGIVTDAAFSPDGSRVATASGDGSVRLWPVILQRHELVKKARDVAPSCLSLEARRKYYLSTTPPPWCIEMKKRPFNTAAWRDWLKARKAGRNPDMPR